MHAAGMQLDGGWMRLGEVLVCWVNGWMALLSCLLRACWCGAVPGACRAGVAMLG